MHEERLALRLYSGQREYIWAFARGFVRAEISHWAECACITQIPWHVPLLSRGRTNLEWENADFNQLRQEIRSEAFCAVYIGHSEWQSKNHEKVLEKSRSQGSHLTNKQLFWGQNHRIASSNVHTGRDRCSVQDWEGDCATMYSIVLRHESIGFWLTHRTAKESHSRGQELH
jgi:hypothetical protein